MNSSRIFLQRFTPSMLKATGPMTRRAAFSSDCAPAQKLRSVFEDYRQKNFSDEIPSRFRKHIIREIEEPDHQTIHLDNLNRVLANIGREDAFLSKEEMETLLQDAGCDTHQKYMPIDKMVELM